MTRQVAHSNTPPTYIFSSTMHRTNVYQIFDEKIKEMQTYPCGFIPEASGSRGKAHIEIGPWQEGGEFSSSLYAHCELIPGNTADALSWEFQSEVSMQTENATYIASSTSPTTGTLDFEDLAGSLFVDKSSMQHHHIIPSYYCIPEESYNHFITPAGPLLPLIPMPTATWKTTTPAPQTPAHESNIHMSIDTSQQNDPQQRWGPWTCPRCGGGEYLLSLTTKLVVNEASHLSLRYSPKIL